jgi:hypothetical protein
MSRIADTGGSRRHLMETSPTCLLRRCSWYDATSTMAACSAVSVCRLADAPTLPQDVCRRRQATTVAASAG